jgi:Protein of unknown function (DUF1153)
MLETKRGSQTCSTIRPHEKAQPSAGAVDSSLVVKVDLPPPDTRRWVVSRKVAVLSAVRTGAITADEACARYEISKEELLAWQHAFASQGLSGLRATRLPTNRSRRAVRSRP